MASSIYLQERSSSPSRCTLATSAVVSKDDETSGAGGLTAGPDEGIEPEGGRALGGRGGRAVGSSATPTSLRRLQFGLRSENPNKVLQWRDIIRAVLI